MYDKLLDTFLGKPDKAWWNDIVLRQAKVARGDDGDDDYGDNHDDEEEEEDDNRDYDYDGNDDDDDSKARQSLAEWYCAPPGQGQAYFVHWI